MNRALSTAFGLVMAASAALQANDVALIAALAAAGMVLAGNVFRSLATAAVVLTAAAIVLDDTPPTVAALCGLAATGYLVLGHTATVTAPTVMGAVGCTAVGLGAVALPLDVPWLPLAAPLTVVALVVIATRPFWASPR
jgi:hypothetical protein